MTKSLSDEGRFEDKASKIAGVEGSAVIGVAKALHAEYQRGLEDRTELPYDEGFDYGWEVGRKNGLEEAIEIVESHEEFIKGTLQLGEIRQRTKLHIAKALRARVFGVKTTI